MHVEIENQGFVVRKIQSQKLGFFELYILKRRTQERELQKSSGDLKFVV